jgi:hypothetical protein
MTSFERTMRTAAIAQAEFEAALEALNGTILDGMWIDEARQIVPVSVDLAAPHVDWGCCDDPAPRVHDGTGRFFCYNCRRWLDQRIDKPTEGDTDGGEDSSSEGDNT